MELKAKDIYHIECLDALSGNALASLYCLYQPILGKDAISVYVTMVQEGKYQRTIENHARLCEILNMSIDDLEKARKKCEEFFLMKTFMKEEEGRNHYVYILTAPLSTNAFLSHKEFKGMLIKALGQKQYELTASKLSFSSISTNGFKDITKALNKAEIKRYELEYEVEYAKIQPRYNFNDDGLIQFDYETFINEISPLVFPIELRTEENLKVIGRIATLYGLSVSKMVVLVGRSVNLMENSFNSSVLKQLASKQAPDESTNKDPYLLSPVSFLQSKQNGAAVTSIDKKLLEHLMMDMNFNSEVINVLIEYVLKINSNRLSTGFVDRIAGEWAREGVTTRAQALEKTKKPVQTFTKKSKDVLPQYFTEEESSDKKELSKKVDKDNINKMLKEMGKKNGKN